MSLNKEFEIADFYEVQNITDYENSHRARFDFLIEDLKLNSLKDQKIIDIGCGPGFIHKRLSNDIQKNYTGIDGADLKNLPFSYSKVDLDNFITTEKRKYDVALCFETLEHLCNPYNCLLQIKNMLKLDGIAYISIPDTNVTHNTIYPGLLYPIHNFIQFLDQMAFEIVEHKIHDKAWTQHVFVLRNKDWSFSKMLFYKGEDKFRNVPPHVAVNL